MAEYFIHAPTGKFGGLHLVPSDQPIHEGSSAAWRRDVIDLAAARELAQYDKRGSRILVGHVKAAIFPGKKITRKLLEAFFDDEENFHLEAE